MSLSALREIELAGAAVNKVAKSAEGEPAAAPYVAKLVAALYELESRAHADLSTRAKRPLPAPDASKVGSWATSLRANRAALAPIMTLATPDWIPAYSKQIQTAAAGLDESLLAARRQAPRMAAPPASRPAPVSVPQQAAPAAQGFSGAGTVAAAAIGAVVGGPISPIMMRKVLGAGLQLAAALGMGGVALGLRKHEKKMKDDGLTVDEDAEPDIVRSRSQRILDNELPGSSVVLAPTPDGRWLASVKRGSETIARAPGRKPNDAAGIAIERALEYDDLRKFPAKAKIVKADDKVFAKPKKAKRTSDAEGTKDSSGIEFISGNEGESAVDVTPAA